MLSWNVSNKLNHSVWPMLSVGRWNYLHAQLFYYQFRNTWHSCADSHQQYSSDMIYGKRSKQRIVNYDMGCDCGKHLETEAEKEGCQKSAELEARDQVIIKMAIILPTGQRYAPSAVINDAWYCMVLHCIA